MRDRRRGAAACPWASTVCQGPSASASATAPRTLGGHEGPDPGRRRGTRLRPITHTRAKQLVPVANTPILFYGIDSLASAPASPTSASSPATRGAEVLAALGDGSRFGASITYIPQDAPLGLAHCVLIAREFLADDEFVMYLGDNLLEQDLAAFVEAFRRGPSPNRAAGRPDPAQAGPRPAPLRHRQARRRRPRGRPRREAGRSAVRPRPRRRVPVRRDRSTTPSRPSRRHHGVSSRSPTRSSGCSTRATAFAPSCSPAGGSTPAS